MTLLYFILYEYVKTVLWTTSERVIAAVETVTSEVLPITWEELDYRLEVNRAINGPPHIEEYYKQATNTSDTTVVSVGLFIGKVLRLLRET